ncbi:hypothetical protein SeLEV6574_g00723 [Synchytrium endobioticum]|uniref:Uncharacterized protein n=1 Tax=Synchytrium endobioticum TaxID=286115 RepID=A0A507DHP7_9FUNG|nr:hypothetical protein SeLEV6574_g00723 [Synchytrium endobioticum]
MSLMRQFISIPNDRRAHLLRSKHFRVSLPPDKKKNFHPEKTKTLGRRDCGAHHSSTVANMLTLFILISILLLQSSHAADTDQTVDQLNAWRGEIRKFRYNLINMDEEERNEWNDRYNIALVPQDKCWDQQQSRRSCPRKPTCFRPSCSHKYLNKYGEDLLSCLFIADIVPSGAPITLKSLKKLPEDLSQDFLELYWEFYETIMCARKVFRFYLWRTSTSMYEFVSLQLARNIQEQLMQNILPPIVGPTNNRIKEYQEASASCNSLMAMERARLDNRLKQL